MDISPTAIAWAKEKAESTAIKGKFFVADLTKAYLKLPEQYHVIIDGNCLHCIIGNDRSVFLHHVYNSLESNGVFFVSSLCSKDSENHQIYKSGVPYRHISSVTNLIAELEHSGFSVLKTTLYKNNKYNHVTVLATIPEKSLQTKNTA